MLEQCFQFIFFIQGSLVVVFGSFAKDSPYELNKKIFFSRIESVVIE